MCPLGGDAVLEICRNNFTGENSEQSEAYAKERSKFAKQLESLGEGGF